jgi:tRNA(adenine34) deaminase
MSQPLRDDALRTPEERFATLSDLGSTARWTLDLPSQRGWRLHYIETGPVDAPWAVLCLHAPGRWSYFFRHLLAVPGVRWLAPDLIGFGKSDKPKRDAVHSWKWHCDVLLEWLEALKCPRLLIACAEGAEPLAELLLEAAPHRFVPGVVPTHVPDASDGSAATAWRAPFPDRGFEAGLRVLGRAPAESSGPSAAQASEVASQFGRIAAMAMGYCRP